MQFFVVVVVFLDPFTAWIATALIPDYGRALNGVENWDWGVFFYVIIAVCMALGIVAYQ